MASKKQVSILVLSLFTASSIIKSSHAEDWVSKGGSISTYWGQHSDEGTLKAACDSNNYNIVILQYLYVYDNRSTPVLNLANHCGAVGNPCTKLEPEIIHCQTKGIQVFLSIGGIRTVRASHRHSLASSSQDVAKNQFHPSSAYISKYFLSGEYGPLGSVALDGIDFSSVPEGENVHLYELATMINAYTTERKIHLSAAPQCVYPDYYLDTAIKTGLFDYIWVEFFHKPSCEYSDGNPENLFTAWNKWITSVQPNKKLFLGVPASPEAATSGYIPVDVLKSDILPVLKNSSNFGGVMIWDRYYDRKTNYSGQIKGSLSKICKCVCDEEPVSGSFYGLLSQAL